ncbi:hypothetical protein SAMN05421772_112133 [Paracoccus saliphilus]|uniref:Uncharacterized protein n=1 Tax=Paracoccus saliphilus TaxID=405559 RepID=A0AA46A6R7_9RHOB|nr:hypothetical protein SAMN05421772_112133 [Paracoccus saliphilus]
MRGSLLYSLLELAHATSKNLGFAHRDDVHVSYGEETITETNLLELRRRHPAIITLHTFGKKKEALNGADWEWHIIGRRRKFRMRVQAKRLQKNGVLKIPHKVKSSGAQQIDLLIKDAKANRLQPIYCIYSAENQRNHWAIKPTPGDFVEFEYGCLLVSANTVKANGPRALGDIETHCIPWHYLVERCRYVGAEVSDILEVDGSEMRFVIASGALSSVTDEARAIDSVAVSSFPTLDELNASVGPSREIDGLIDADDPEYERRSSEEEYRERRIGRLVEIDVREIPVARDDEDAV